MRRRTMHAAFALATLAAGALVAVQGTRLWRLQRLQAAVAEAASAPATATDDMLRDAPRAVRLARATALAQAGAADAAVRLYGGLIEPGRVDAIGRDALFDLGNLYLRQGLGLGRDPKADAAAAGPLVELAKQRYRDLLRADPGDWDARHNLERALRLAPEEHEAVVEADSEPVERRQVQLRGMTPGDLP
ncbi:MxaK protein [Leptothrix sp. BB-4]